MNKKALIKTLGRLCKDFFESELVLMDAGEQTVSVYLPNAVSYNKRLLDDQRVGEWLNSHPQPPFLTCHIENDTIVSDIAPEGVEGTENELMGLLTIALAKHTHNGIILACGGILNVLEADDSYNLASLAIICGMQLLYKRPLMGKINVYDAAERIAIVDGTKSSFTELDGTVKESNLKNFCADFILPPVTVGKEDRYKELTDMLRYWNASPEQRQPLKAKLGWPAEKSARVGEIFDSIEALGGAHLGWK